jgi:hypothetical protein
MCAATFLAGVLAVSSPGVAPDDKPLAPAEAAKQVGRKVTVEITVRATKNALEHRSVIFLDSEADFRDPKNFAVVIPKAALDKFQAAGVADPVAYYKGKTIRATGTVSQDEKKKPQIIVEDPKQVRVVEKGQ